MQRRLGPVLNRSSVPAPLFAGPLSREYRFYPLLLARLHVEGVLFDVLDDVLLQDLAFEALQCALQTFPVVNLYFSQRSSPFLIERSTIQGSSLHPKRFENVWFNSGPMEFIK